MEDVLLSLHLVSHVETLGLGVFFFTDGLLFHSKNSYKNVWCIACLNHHKELLRQSDVLGAAMSGTSGDRRDADREAQGE